jgi:hypothetical protein
MIKLRFTETYSTLNLHMWIYSISRKCPFGIMASGKEKYGFGSGPIRGRLNIRADNFADYKLQKIFSFQNL